MVGSTWIGPSGTGTSNSLASMRVAPAHESSALCSRQSVETFTGLVVPRIVISPANSRWKVAPFEGAGSASCRVVKTAIGCSRSPSISWKSSSRSLAGGSGGGSLSTLLRLRRSTATQADLRFRRSALPTRNPATAFDLATASCGNCHWRKFSCALKPAWDPGCIAHSTAVRANDPSPQASASSFDGSVGLGCPAVGGWSPNVRRPGVLCDA